MHLRRLNPDESDLLREVYSWDTDYPQWYQDIEKTERIPLEQFISEAPLRADIGIFDDELIALISILQRGQGVFEGHVWAKRGTCLELLVGATQGLIKSLREDLGMRIGYVWVAKFNLPIKKLCIMAGLRFDGAVVADGESHGRPIIWQRFVTAI